MSKESRSRFYLVDLVAVVICCGVITAIVIAIRERREEGLLVPLLAGVIVVWFLLRSRRSGLKCDECGRRFQSVKRIDPANVSSVCPNCRSRNLSPVEAEKEHGKGRRVLIFALGIMVIVGVFCVAQVAAWILNSGGSMSFPVPLALAPLILFFFAWKLLVFFIRSRRLNGLLSEERSLALARDYAGEIGSVAHDGTVTIWYSGTNDPTPMLRDEIVASHRRFETLLDETDVADPPLRILCFHDRGALLKFYKATFPGFDLAAHLGIYLQRPWRILALCTGEVLGRLDDPQTRAGSLYDQVLLEQLFPTLPGPWLQPGLARALAACGRRADLVALNRRMLASLAGGTAWSEDLFSISANKMSKLFKRPNDPLSAQRAEQYNDQSWSIVEYLAGVQAAEPRRAAFRAFLKDKRSNASQEESFFRHLGFGFGSLLDSWRQWVLEQGAGVDEPPAPRVRAALENSVLPVIRDPQAPRADRIQAIRDWRRAGTTLGADALVALLRDPGDLPKEEIEWALSGAAGTSSGDSAKYWQA